MTEQEIKSENKHEKQAGSFAARLLFVLMSVFPLSLRNLTRPQGHKTGLSKGYGFLRYRFRKKILSFPPILEMRAGRKRGRDFLFPSII